MTPIVCIHPVTQSLKDWVSKAKHGLRQQEAYPPRLDEMRFENLVLSLLDMEIEEAAQVNSLADSDKPFERSGEPFYETLQRAVRQLRLWKLFARTSEGARHRSVCPAAYNERTGEHYPEEMARWRADFRALFPEQQMVAATIVWMYRAGPDSIWLRRVPCTWRASEALHYMNDAGCLAMWLQLVAGYPGW